jgi:hypothetical protein
VKRYAAAAEALRENERGVKTGWNSVYHKNNMVLTS